MSVNLLTDQHLEILSLKGGCTGSSESTLVKIPHSWKSRVTAQIFVRSNGKCKIKQNHHQFHFMMVEIN